MIRYVLDRYAATVLPRLRSRSGATNPRVSHISSTGYAIRAYLALQPNLRAWLKDRAPLFPTAVLVQTLNRCNGACSMCPYPQTVAEEPPERMPDDLWEKIIQECAAEPGFALLVPTSKNEPLLDPHLDERIARFRRLAQPHQVVELVTNGALLDRARLARLADAGVDLITISVNANTAATYARTNGRLSFERLVRNLESFRPADKARVNLFVRFVRTRYNAGEEAAFRRRWRAAGFNIFAFEVNNRAGAVTGYADLLPPATRGSRLRQMVRRWLSRAIFPVCPYLFSIANVMQNGDVVLCANDWLNHEVLGNVRHQTIREIFNGARLQEIRELMRQGRYAEIGPCRDCSLWLASNWL